MTKTTVAGAVSAVLQKHPDGLNVSEITSKIKEQGLYTFNTATPDSVVAHAIRKSCVSVDIGVSNNKENKQFKSVGNGKYALNR